MLFLFFLSLSFFSTKCTARLAGRYISFLRLGVEKPVQPKVSEGRKEGKETVRVSFRVQ